MATLKVTQIGNSLGVILPKEVAARLKVEKGDELAYVETPGGIELTSYDPSFEETSLRNCEWQRNFTLSAETQDLRATIARPVLKKRHCGTETQIATPSNEF